MFEHKSSGLLPRRAFLLRQVKFTSYAVAMLAFSLGAGMLGYHLTQGLGWVDSLLNASMILTGMGPVSPMTSDGAKLFASFYALYSGVAFLTIFAVFLAPIVHRFMHILHLQG